jgi:hypothetical protein
MKSRRWAAMLCVLPIVGCQSAVVESSSPAPSAPAPIMFAVAGDEPVIDPADYGAAYLLPGATAVHDGTLHLFPVAFFADPSEPPRVLHLVSNDGVAWSGDPDASVLEDFALELDDVGAVPSSAYVTDDGTWVMFGGGRQPGGDRPVAWRATAPGPDGPWTAHPAPILEPVEDGWDTAIVDHPSVIPVADGYLMAYGGAARTAPNRNRIGLATSEDGVSWTRIDATMDGADDEHALGPDACGINARTMVEPHLLAIDGGQLLVFGVMPKGSDTDMQILTATSPDGRTWTCASGAEALGSDNAPGGRSIHSVAVIDHPDAPPSLLIEVLGDAHSTLWLGRAAD